MSSTSSWASTTTPALDLTPPSAPAGGSTPMLARDSAAASERETTTTTIQIQQLRDHADALLLELDAVAYATEAAKMATRHAERRAREAAAEICRLDVSRTSGVQDEKKLRELGEELRDKDARIKLLEAIVATLADK